MAPLFINGNFSKKELEKIWQQVPPDYYQKGVSSNMLQRMWHNAKLKAVIALINGSAVKKPRKILDVGCASGWFLNELHEKYPLAEAYGVDVYSHAISFGKKRYPYFKLTQADAHKLPYSANTFDIVVCTEVLEHVVDPEKVLVEIKRVLTKDGVAIIEMDSGNLLFQLVWYWWTNVRHGVWSDAHIQAFNTSRLFGEINKSGLKIITSKTFNFSMAVACAATK